MIMSVLLFYVALFSLLIVIVITLELLRGVRSLGFLEDVPPIGSSIPPLVSVVIPARNEKKHLEMALQSVLGQKYPTFEIIVIDDRSTDETGEILDRMAAHNPMLRVFHIQQLPQGWLGKNYALSYGASQARGDLLLFTDADVIMEPTTMSRAVSYLNKERLDHLTLSPTLSMPSLTLRIFVTGFYFFFSLYARPWKARDSKSLSHIGIGAFNLISRQAYHAIGTHQAIAMRPDDDMKLAKIVKKNGLSQGFLFGNRFISVEWYASVRELINGMMKNSFAGLEYQISIVIVATLGQFMLFIWPFLALFLTGGLTRMVYGIIVVILLILLGYGAHLCHGTPWLALGLPLASALLIYIFWKSMVQTLWRQGIYWRETYYPLRLLKANKV
jgi:glycosyltransferase involved in cell wall biosynthesis